MTTIDRGKPAARCPSQFALEKFLHGLAGSDTREHVQACSICEQRLQEMRTAGEEYKASFEADQLRNQLAESKTGGSLPASWRQRLPNPFVWIAAPVAVAACVVLLVLPSEVEQPPNDGFIAKGNGVLRVVLHRDGRIEDWTGTDLLEGDTFQLVWSASERGYLAVLSQSRDEVTVLFPEAAGRAAQVDAGGDQALGGSLTTDAPTVGLRIWAFFTEKPFAIQQLKNALRQNDMPIFRGQIIQLGPSDQGDSGE